MEEPQPNKKKEKSDDEGGMTAYSKYSTIAIQMVVIIAGTSFGGVKLDQVAGTKHLFTVILSLLGVIAAMWLIIKEALRKK
ncbi:MAG TPA: AtpZ/AtpI family protein [Bacteroidales bacterium]|nr:AtpZ/AtpI family protein [Bacteroidales bacterium]